jgi:hypothetical protein
MFRAAPVAALAWLGLTGAGACTRANPAFWQAEPDAAPPVHGLAALDAGIPDAAPAGASPDAAEGGASDAGGDLRPDPPDGWTAATDLAGDAGPAPGARLSITNEMNTAIHGAARGILETDRCPPDEVLIGYTGSSEPVLFFPYVAGLEGICGTLVLPPEGSGTVKIGPGGRLPDRGRFGNRWSALCPYDEVIVGFRGRSGNALDQVGFHCAPLRWDGVQVSLGLVRTLPSHGGGGGSSFDTSCPAGQVALGHKVQSSAWIDSFGLVCGTPARTP